MGLCPQAVDGAGPGEEGKFRSSPYGLDNQECLPDIVLDCLDERRDSASRKTDAVLMEVVDMAEKQIIEMVLLRKN